MTSTSSLPHLRGHAVPLPSLGGALRAVGYTCIGAAFVSTFAFQSGEPGGVLWPALVALASMLLLLWLDDRVKSSLTSAAFLTVGALAVFIFITDFHYQVAPSWLSDAFTPALVKVPLMMVGGSATQLATRLGWTLVGYVVAEAAAAAAILEVGQTWTFDMSSMLAFVAITIFVLGTNAARRRATKHQSLLFIAAQDDELAAMKHRIELQAAALLHDTVLSHLAAIAHAPEGATTAALRPAIERDVELLASRGWLDDRAADDQQAALVNWVNSPVFSAIQEAEDFGLRVQPTGDLSALARLAPEQIIALGLAVKQCLMNVLHHSGIDFAEVAIDAAPEEVSVMVVDAGRGFIEKDTGPDRMGLRHSVHRRMELVGGTAQVWSTPGRGTSVIMRVPVHEPSSDERATQ